MASSRPAPVFLLLAFAAASAVFVACADDGDEADGEPFTLVVHPEFVQGVLPETAVSVLVSVEDSGGEGAVDISAEYSGGEVRVEPESIQPGEVAEVTVVADRESADMPSELVVTASRGDVEHTIVRQFPVIPWEDDRGETARQLLELFAAWLADEHPDLGVEPGDDYEGAFVAPQLLVVSHYEFWDDDVELGLSWHVMTAPDDWSELYIRPRAELQPVRAFRLSSWSTALAGGEAEFTEVPPPVEVVR